jgi:hypothetical protein
MDTLQPFYRLPEPLPTDVKQFPDQAIETPEPIDTCIAYRAAQLLFQSLNPGKSAPKPLQFPQGGNLRRVVSLKL